MMGWVSGFVAAGMVIFPVLRCFSQLTGRTVGRALAFWAMNLSSEEFDESRLIEALSVSAGCSADGCSSLVLEALWGFAGESLQSDGITCLVLRRDP